MGGSGFSTRFKPLRGAKGAEVSALYDELYAIIRDNIERVAKGKVYRQVTEDFLPISDEDGEGRDDLVSFHFRDGAGLCQASVHVCYHWFQLYLSALALKKGKAPSALDTIAERHGLALDDKLPKLETLLEKCAEPLVELRGHVFGVSGPTKNPYIVSDSLDEGHVEMGDLTEKERAKVRAASTKQRCDCIVCVTLRKKIDLKLPKPKKEPKPKKPPKFGVETHFFEDGKALSVSDDKATVLPDALFGLSTLERFRIRAPITTIPDGIERLTSLRELTLYSSKMTRLPDVVLRMKSIVHIGVHGSPFDALAQLTQMPWLERLELGRLSSEFAIDDVPLTAFPKLTALKLDGLGKLPKTLTRAKGLKELEITDDKIKALPSSIGDLAQLETLTLWLDEMKTLPSLAKLENLRVLSIQSSSLETIDEGALPNGLVDLRLATDTLRGLPASMAKLTKLEKLELNGAFTTLPPVIGKLGALKQLSVYASALVFISEATLPKSLTDLSFCDCPALTALPSRVGDMVALRGFAAIRTGLTSLPDAMRRAKRIEHMYLTGTGLTTLPAWFGELSALDYLTLSSNAKLGPLPASMKKLKKLTCLTLDETPGVFPLAGWIKDLPIESLSITDCGVSRAEKARMKKLLPKTRFA